jgi:hypothetical protein
MVRIILRMNRIVVLSQVLTVLKSLKLKIFNNFYILKIGILVLCILLVIPILAPVSPEESSAWTKTNGPSGGGFSWIIIGVVIAGIGIIVIGYIRLIRK